MRYITSFIHRDGRPRFKVAIPGVNRSLIFNTAELAALNRQITAEIERENT